MATPQFVNAVLFAIPIGDCSRHVGAEGKFSMQNRPPQHCSSGKSDPEAWPSHATGSRYRSPHTAFDDHKQHRLDAGEEQALRPQRSHAHAVKHDGGHKDTAPEAPQHDTHGHENAHGHRMEQRNGRKRSHPHAVQPSGHGSDTAGCRDMEWGGEDWGNEGGMDDEAGEEPAHGYRDSDRHISAGTRNGAHAHMMEDVDAGSGDEPARKVCLESQSVWSTHAHSKRMIGGYPN